MVIPTIVALIFVQTAAPPETLPASAVAQLRASLTAAARHPLHDWRDLRPLTPDGRLNVLVEIGRGDRRKFELDIGANRLRLDRTMPPSLGGYPVNYGLVPQTVSYDGDPFDVFVLGPAIQSGTLVQGVIVGLFRMADEKGLDSKVVISPVDAAGQPRYQLTDADKRRIEAFFSVYKRHEPGKFSRVHGWGTAAAGLAFVRMTHAFFEKCRTTATDCVVADR